MSLICQKLRFNHNQLHSFKVNTRFMLINVNINQAFAERRLKIVHFKRAIQPVLSSYYGYDCGTFLLWRQIGLDKVKFVQVFQSEKCV